MGQRSSTCNMLEKCLGEINSDEKERLDNIFTSLAQKDGVCFAAQDLNVYLRGKVPVMAGYSERLFTRLCHVETGSSTDIGTVTKVTYDRFAISLVSLLRGEHDYLDSITFSLANSKPNVRPDSVTGNDLVEFVEDMMSVYYQQLNDSGELQDWCLDNDRRANTSFAKGVVSVLLFKDKTNKPTRLTDEMMEEKIPRQMLSQWLMNEPLMGHIIQSSLMYLFPVRKHDRTQTSVTALPRITAGIKPGFWAHGAGTLLTLPTLLYLTWNIPVECRSSWRLLYSSHSDGSSFSKLASSIINQGPTILIIKDSQSHIFGGYANESWKYCPHFFGTEKCFLFQIHPQLRLSTSTGYNTHFLYMNQGQQTLPNGIGMGGQLEHFGWYLSDEFGTGHSWAQPRCTTFNSPQLSSLPEFSVHTVEAWALVEPTPVDDEDDEDITKSVLDSHGEATAILEIAGKHRVSEGLRGSSMTEANPGDKTLDYSL